MHLAALSRLPLIEGAFSLELAPPTEGGVTLRYRGVERVSLGWNGPESVEEVDRPLFLEFSEHPRLAPVVDAWLDVLAEVFREQASRAEPSLPARAVLPWSALLTLLKDDTLEGAALHEAWRLEFAAFLPPSPALVAAHAALDAWLRSRESPTLATGEKDSLVTTLEYVSNELRAGAVMVVVRLIVWQREPSGELMIRDVKEQDLVLLTAGPGLEPPTRVVNFYIAWCEATSKLLERIDAEVMMPHDFLLTPQRYKRGQSVDDFRKLLWRKLKLG
ncbi:MAG: hypothetical protein Q8S33_30870 [Myxococcales bacterium]|nr:hypothetical protein [Myxococcales bacterium]